MYIRVLRFGGVGFDRLTEGRFEELLQDYSMSMHGALRRGSRDFVTYRKDGVLNPCHFYSASP